MTRSPGIRWWIIGLIGVATVINYVDRSSLAIMWPAISQETGISKERYATIAATFMVCYAVGQALSGRLFDRIGTRLGFVVSIVVWSCACALHATARTAVHLGFVRGLLGLSEAGNWPGATKAVAEWFPRQERALAQGIFNAGASLGAVVSATLIAWLFTVLGWRATFLFIAALGLVWIVPWWFLARSTPEAHPWVSPQEREHILGGAAAATTGSAACAPAMSWREALGHRQTWSVVAARFFLDPIWWIFVTWLPIYLAERFHFNVREIGYFGWVPYVGAAIGSLSGGWVSGYWISRGWTVDRARKRAIHVGALLTVPAFILAAFAATPLVAVLTIALVLCGFQIMINNIQTLPSDFYSGRSVGTVAGIGGMSAASGVLVFSMWLIPAISRVSYTPVFLLGAALVPLAVGSVHLFAREIRRVDLPTDRA